MNEETNDSIVSMNLIPQQLLTEKAEPELAAHVRWLRRHCVM